MFLRMLRILSGPIAESQVLKIPPPDEHTMDTDKLEQWKEEQSELQQKLREPHAAQLPEGHNTQYLVGMDISLVKGTDEGVCTAILLEYPSMTEVDSVTIPVTITEPYVAGFLAFRELPHYLRALGQLQLAYPTMVCRSKAVIVVDGNGVLHPSGCGLASHLGVAANMPTIGCGKNLHQYEALAQTKAEIKENIREQRAVDTSDMLSIPITDCSCAVHGYAVCAPDVINPVYISRGYIVSDTDCLDIIRNTLMYREPEPVRLADRSSREYLRTH